MNAQDILKRITETAHRFRFFELTRALEAVLGTEVGPTDSPDLERITFSHDPTLAYPMSDVASAAAESSIEVTIRFLGLLGTVSPLTADWTDDLLLGDDDGALRAFYDVFHHRTATYLYSAWRTHSSEGAFDLRGADILSARLRSLAGIDAWAASDDDPFPPMLALGFADHQHGQPQTVDREAVERLLVRLFPDWSVRLETNVLRFVTFTKAERIRLGSSRAKLNGSLVYGDGCDDEAGAVRIHVGPVERRTYEELMPGGGAYSVLERTASRIFGGTVDVELEVHLLPDQAPVTRLGQAAGSRLGVDTRYGSTHDDNLSVRVPLVADGADARRLFVFPPEHG